MTIGKTVADSLTDRRWSIAEVPAAFAELHALADAQGFAPALFGSVMKTGEGRDLDVMMLTKWKAKTDYHIFLALFGGALERRFPVQGDAQYDERVERGSHSYEVRKDGRLYHFCFGRF